MKSLFRDMKKTNIFMLFAKCVKRVVVTMKQIHRLLPKKGAENNAIWL